MDPRATKPRGFGVSIPFDWCLRGVLAVRYNYSLKSGDTPAQEYVGISVGLAWN